MTSEETRRTFLGSLLLGGGSVAAFGKSFQQDEGPGPAGPGDALFEHIQQQLSGVLRGAKARGGFLSAESAGTAAAFMRVCAVHARGLQLDDAARRALANRVAGVGRDALINLPPDLTGVRSSMRRKGFVISDQLIDRLATSDVATRATALETIERGQSTRVCDALAEAFEAAAPKLASERTRLRRTAAPDQEWCNFLVGQWTMYLAIAWYVASFDDSTMQAFLDAMWAGFVTYDLLYQQQC
jgi:hypothetical protein